MFDPPKLVPYSKIDEKILDSAEHRALARKMANESMVLLKNDGVLPLKTVKRIAVGPLADQTAVLLGNYNGTPTHTMTVLEGMKAEFPQAKITYPWHSVLSKHGDPVTASGLAARRQARASEAEYGSRPGFDSKTTPLASRVEPDVNLAQATCRTSKINQNAVGAMERFPESDCHWRLRARHQGRWLRKSSWWKIGGCGGRMG